MTIQDAAFVLIIGLTVGFIIGAVLMYVLVVQNQRMRAELDRRRLMQAQMRDIARREYQAVRRGYDLPSLADTMAVKQPGLRVVGGERLYSSAWLNDDASVS